MFLSRTISRPNVVLSYISRRNLNLSVNEFNHKRHWEKCNLRYVKPVFPLMETKRNFYTTSFLKNQANLKEEHSFQAETKMLLDIVAKSLYSDKEVFVRELISNASDAIEKLRYQAVQGDQSLATDFKILITTDKYEKTLTFEDNGIGMTKEELISNLGTIARSGSKEYIKQVKEGADSQNIIGQFGVGFYSAFMVSDKVTVYTKSSNQDSPGYCWQSDGCGTYSVEECPDLPVGTKIVCHLKPEHREFYEENTVKNILTKYSSFVGFPIMVNGNQANSMEALWMKDPKQVTDDDHKSFYRFIGNAYDYPVFTFHFQTDAPINLRALLYFPETKPGLFDAAQETENTVALYSRKVLIQSKSTNLVPKWLRFVKGVVDSEDIPLNLSREMLQDSALIRRLRTVIQNKVIRFLSEKARKVPEKYKEFYTNYGLYLKEGILGSQEQLEKEEIARLLMYESSHKPAGEMVSFSDYISRMPEDQKEIYYLAAPSRELAENSPYYESLKKKGVEVLFCYENYDEVVLIQLRQFNNKYLVSVEKELRQSKDDVDHNTDGALNHTEANNLVDYMKGILSGKCHHIKFTSHLEAHPCIVTVEEMGAARHFMKTQFTQFSEEARYSILKPQLELNPKHPIIIKLSQLKDKDPRLSELLTKHLFSSGMVNAGLLDDPRKAMSSVNELLEICLEK